MQKSDLIGFKLNLAYNLSKGPKVWSSPLITNSEIRLVDIGEDLKSNMEEDVMGSW